MVMSLPTKAKDVKRHGFDPWVGKIPWRRAQLPTLIYLRGESHGQRAWQATAHRVRKESDMTEATEHAGHY